jgi:hypothetical protein
MNYDVDYKECDLKGNNLMRFGTVTNFSRGEFQLSILRNEL